MKKFNAEHAALKARLDANTARRRAAHKRGLNYGSGKGGMLDGGMKWQHNGENWHMGFMPTKLAEALRADDARYDLDASKAAQFAEKGYVRVDYDEEGEE